MSRPQALLSWSSGKDSAFALGALRERAEVDVVGLVTTINSAARRVAMHAVREEILDLQAEAVALPVWKVEIPSPCPNDVYEAAMGAAIERAVSEGIEYIAFADLFLADIRQYREERLAGTGIKLLFPLWERDTKLLAREMIESGIKATLTCVDPKQLGREFAGREFGKKLLEELPEQCDPCGENGEFHTFACDGPAFRHSISVQTGEVVDRDGFVFADVTLADQQAAVARKAG